MSSHDLNAYAQDLSSFTRTRMHVVSTGEPVNVSTLNRLKQAERVYNKHALAEQKRIDAIQAPGFSSVVKNMWTTGRFNESTGRYSAARGSVHGAVTEVRATNDPRNQSAAEKRLQALERGASTPYSDFRDRSRQNLVQMLGNRGMPELANIVQRMSADQLDVLVNRTDIWGLLSTMGYAYMPEYEGWTIAIDESEYSKETGAIVELIAQARTIGTNYDAERIKKRIGKIAIPRSLETFNKKQAAAQELSQAFSNKKSSRGR